MLQVEFINLSLSREIVLQTPGFYMLHGVISNLELYSSLFLAFSDVILCVKVTLHLLTKNTVLHTYL